VPIIKRFLDEIDLRNSKKRGGQSFLNIYL